MELASFNIQNGVALVTGANRGFGAAFVQALRAAGAKKVYAAAREIAGLGAALAGTGGTEVVPLRLDITNSRDVEAAAAKCADVNLLINNAAINNRGEQVLDPASLLSVGAEWETNVVAPVRMIQTFAPLLAKNGGGAILNVLTALTWMSMPGRAGWYSATKAALWSLTNSVRNDLRGQGTLVSALHAAFMATNMTEGLQMPKVDPLDIARLAVNALQAGEEEILADEISRRLKQGLSSGVYLRAPKAA
jgi:NAD(P)-dependent dehydrogenase (short-subunit alcohol dehydrogenase family)